MKTEQSKFDIRFETLVLGDGSLDKKKIKRREYIKQNIPLFFMSLPAIFVLILFSYVPMFGLILGFKDYSYRKGIFGSAWVGLDNFKYIFSSGEIYRTLKNTILYHIAFSIAILVCSVFVAIMLYFIRSKTATKIYQESIILPYSISYVVISYIVYIFLNSDYGLVNKLLVMLGSEEISWYTTPKYWPVIFVIVQVWFGAGIKSVYYYGSLMAIDTSLFESAELDGANRWNKIRHIMFPSLAPVVSIFMILDLGAILDSSFSLFYSVPLDSSALYSVTDVLSTYTYRGLMTAEIGTTTALGLFTGLVTTVMTLLVNTVVKKISPENSLL